MREFGVKTANLIGRGAEMEVNLSGNRCVVECMRTNWVRAAVSPVAVILLLAGMASAQTARDLAGTWQGVLPIGKGVRLVLKVAKNGGQWSGLAYDLASDVPSEGRTTTQMSLTGNEVRFAIAPIGASFEGRLSEDGASITGTWTQGGQARPFSLTRATGDAEWEIPKATAKMAADADPDWDVVTVKPADPAENNASVRMDGREFVMTNRSVETLLLIGYSVHKKQIVNAPDWIRTERWDIKGIPDVPGQPSLRQMQALARKVLTARFGLVAHTEKREMDVYALTASKSGEKMTPSGGDPNGLPDENDNENGGVRTMRAANISMGEFALIMKFFMDRPVVDQTGLAGRYDFQLRWTFDDSRVAPDSNAPPGLFTAIQEQLGLKLEATKAQTDVLVLDAVKHPSAN
jgi:uncharacterized protein (TIGR03435 family)